MKIQFILILLVVVVSCSEGISHQSYRDRICNSLFSCVSGSDLDSLGFDAKNDCDSSMSEYVDKTRWDEYISQLDSKESDECLLSLDQECNESLGIDDWKNLIDVDECDSVYLYPVIGQWSANCTYPTIGESREFILEIQEEDGDLQGKASMTIQNSNDTSIVSCNVEFEYSALELFVSQLTSNISSPLADLTINFSCDNDSSFALPFNIDQGDLLGYCDANNEIELRFERVE